MFESLSHVLRSRVCLRFQLCSSRQFFTLQWLYTALFQCSIFVPEKLHLEWGPVIPQAGPTPHAAIVYDSALKWRNRAARLETGSEEVWSLVFHAVQIKASSNGGGGQKKSKTFLRPRRCFFQNHSLSPKRTGDLVRRLALLVGKQPPCPVLFCIDLYQRQTAFGNAVLMWIPICRPPPGPNFCFLDLDCGPPLTRILDPLMKVVPMDVLCRSKHFLPVFPCRVFSALHSMDEETAANNDPKGQKEGRKHSSRWLRITKQETQELLAERNEEPIFLQERFIP